MTSHPRRPTGWVTTGPAGRQLVIERTFRAPIDDVWASLTEPERFARWYGTMTGPTGAGRTVTVAMTAEREVVEEPALILECEPPSRFVVELGSGRPVWHIVVTLAEHDGTTTMTFVQTLTDDVDVADVGPGWEYYADRLAASRDGSAMPDWDADGYQAALGPHYRAQ